ncbi:4-hydroxyphenylacetate 3-hydroxylase family protein [Niallia sp. 03091]|uniref:4-hydroxyphenylacetate 3-hydroxylase family protein n=1 Tax=Niallia sp. 03091 TaxID=3458059 RepID=UPI00404507CA
MVIEQKRKNKKFIDSLKDGRQVWIDGEKVKELYAHPAFEGTLNTIQALFNQLEDVNVRDKIGFISPITKQYVHNAFLVPKTFDDLHARKETFTFWANQTLGNMSRLAESGRSYLTGWYASRELFNQYDPEFSKKITRIYEQARDENRLAISVVADPQVNRAKSQLEQEDPDLLLRIVKETEEGIIIRGAKVMATAVPYAHDIIVQSSFKFNEEECKYANLLVVPVNTPGIHIICRDSFSSLNKELHPLSSRYEEMDATIVFDDVLVPWDRVLFHQNPQGAWKALKHKRDNSLANHQSVIRLIAKMEFVAGLAFSLTEAIGVHEYLNVQEKLGELVIQIETVKALVSAAEAEAQYDDYGTLWPDPLKLRIAIDLGASYYPRAIEILQQVVGGGLLQVPSIDLEKNKEIQGFIDKYYSGANVTAERKIKLFRLAWDLIGSPLGARHELYDRFFSGDPVRNNAVRYKEYNKDALIKRVENFLKS